MGISQKTADAIIAGLIKKAAANGHTVERMGLSAEQRRTVEQATRRDGVRARARGLGR
jgi:hypothetical protein